MPPALLTSLALCTVCGPCGFKAYVNVYVCLGAAVRALLDLELRAGAWGVD